MAATTRAIHDPLGFPVPVYAALRLVLFVACMPLVLLGMPVLAGLAIYSLAT